MHINRQHDKQVPYPMRPASEPVEPVLLPWASEEGFWEVEGVEEQSDDVAGV